MLAEKQPTRGAEGGHTLGRPNPPLMGTGVTHKHCFQIPGAVDRQVPQSPTWGFGHG